MYFFFKNFFGGPSKPVPREEMLAPKFERGLPVDLNVYLSESPVLRYETGFLFLNMKSYSVLSTL